MYEWIITSIDRATLPTALLPITKTHLRVTFADDDEYIKLCISRAIDLFERHAGWYVFSRDGTWKPASGSRMLPLPVQPVGTMTVVDAGAVDVTADYQFVPSYSTLPWFFERKDQDIIPAGLVVTLAAGFTDMTNLPPSVTDITLRIAAYLYENRESVASYSLDQVPQWMNDLLLGNWIPRA